MKLTDPYVIVSAAFLFLIILLAVITWRRRPLFSIGIFWIFIVFAPVSNFILPMKQIINERFLYFAIPGFILSVSGIAIFLMEKWPNYKKFLIPAFLSFIVIISIIFSVFTFIRLADWKDELSLWRHEIEIKPDDLRNQSNYAYGLELNNRSEESIKYHKQALNLALVPTWEFSDWERSMAKVLAEAYLRIGSQKEAEAVLLVALRRFPGDNELIFDLGQTYLKNKQYSLAAQIFKSLLEKNNDDIALFYVILSERLSGQKDGKIKAEIEKLKNSGLRDNAFSLIQGRQKILEGKWGEAVSILSDILKNYVPPFLEPYFWLAESYEKLNEKEKAVAIYQSIIFSAPSIDAWQGLVRLGGNFY